MILNLSMLTIFIYCQINEQKRRMAGDDEEEDEEK